MTKKNYEKFSVWVMWIVSILIALAIGGGFINGKYLDGFILSWLPLIVHQIAGWTIVLSTLIGAVYHLFFAKKR
jgi:hypothetical protein